MKLKSLTIAVLLPLLLTVSICDYANAAQSGCTLEKLDGTGKINLRELPGKFIYVDFWASWCKPCKESFPFLNALKKQFESAGVSFIGISVDKDMSDANQFLARNKADFMVASDPDGTCSKSMHIKGMPSIFILNKAGEIVYEHVGFRPSDRETVKNAVQKLIDKH